MKDALLSAHHWVSRMEKTGESWPRADGYGGQEDPASQEDQEEDETNHVGAGPFLNQGRRGPLPWLRAGLIDKNEIKKFSKILQKI